MKQKLTEMIEVESFRILVGDLSTPLSILQRIFKQKIKKEAGDLKNIINH